MTDSDIIKLYSDGRQEEAFNGIVHAYTERLYWHIRRFLCSHEDTNDLLQDIFIKIWTALPTFRGDAKLYTWLYRIATNEVLNHLRKKRFKALVSLESSAAIGEKMIDDDPHFNGNQLQRELHKAIQRLPEKQSLLPRALNRARGSFPEKAHPEIRIRGLGFFRRRTSPSAVPGP